jgi:hypothetical protein
VQEAVGAARPMAPTGPTVRKVGVLVLGQVQVQLQVEVVRLLRSPLQGAAKESCSVSQVGHPALLERLDGLEEAAPPLWCGMEEWDSGLT